MNNHLFHTLNIIWENLVPQIALILFSYLDACEPRLLYVCLLVTEIALIWFLSRMHDHMFHRINIIWESLAPQIALIWFLPSVNKIWMAKYGYILPFPSHGDCSLMVYRKNESSYVHVGAHTAIYHSCTNKLSQNNSTYIRILTWVFL